MGTVFSVAEVGPLLTLAYARPRMLTGRKPIREKSSPISAVTILQTGPMPADPHVADIRERKSKYGSAVICDTRSQQVDACWEQHIEKQKRRYAVTFDVLYPNPPTVNARNG
jgi:hypothetical protein